MSAATNQLVNRSRECLGRVRIILQVMKKDLEEKSGAQAGDPEQRMRENMYSTLVKRFEEVLIECDKAQTGFREDAKEKVRRHVLMCTVHAVDDKATEEQIEQLADHPEQIQKLAEQAMVGASISTIHMVEELQDRYNEIAELAKARHT